MDWADYLIRYAKDTLEVQPYTGLHLAVLVEPYLGRILDGSKRIESRWSTGRFAPYGRVETGDVVLLKRSSGPVVGVFTVYGRPSSYVLEGLTDVNFVRRAYGDQLGITDPAFWDAQQGKRYVTLIPVFGAHRLRQPIPIDKTDRRGWVVLRKAKKGTDAR